MANVTKNVVKTIKNTLKVGVAVTDFAASAAAEIVTVENLKLAGEHIFCASAAVLDKDPRKLKKDLAAGWKDPARTAKKLREVIWEDE